MEPLDDDATPPISKSPRTNLARQNKKHKFTQIAATHAKLDQEYQRNASTLLQAKGPETVNQILSRQRFPTGIDALPKIQEPPKLLQVQAQKGNILVYKWGAPPFAVECTIRGIAFIPNGFEAEIISDRCFWVVQTRVLVQDGNVWCEYRFRRRENLDIWGPWSKRPSGAYVDAVNLFLPERAMAPNLKSANGRRLVGLTYYAVQENIQDLFAEFIQPLQLALYARE